MACFADINVSQGSVATYVRCGGIFDIHLTANLPRNLPVEKFLKSVKNWQNYGHESVAPFLAHPVGYLIVRRLAHRFPRLQDRWAISCCLSTRKRSREASISCKLAIGLTVNGFVHSHSLALIHAVSSHSFPFPFPSLNLIPIFPFPWDSHSVISTPVPFRNMHSKTIKCKCKQSTKGTASIRLKKSSTENQVCRGYADPYGDPHGYGYGDRNSVPTAAPQ